MKPTSIEAHNSIKPDKSRLHRIILSGLRRIRRGSFRDIAKASGLRADQVWKRLAELKDQGSIIEDDFKKCPISGRRVTIWAIKEQQDPKQLNLF